MKAPLYNPSLRGYIYMTLAAFCFALMAASGRIASQVVDPFFTVWVRGLGGAAIIAPFMVSRGISLLGHDRMSLLRRSVLGTISVSFLFHAVSLAPLADAISLIKTSALYTPFFAAYFLKEPIERVIVSLTALGFIGVLLVVQPGYAEFNAGLVCALIAGISQALTYVVVRGLSQSENPLTVVLYFLMGSVIFLVPFVSWPTSTEALSVGPALLGTIIAGLIGQIFLTAAYRKAPASRVTPFLYTEVLFSALLGWILLNEAPTALKATGMIIICTSGCLLATRKRAP